MSKFITRREFLKGAGAAALTAAGMSVLPAVSMAGEAVTEAETTNEQETESTVSAAVDGGRVTSELPIPEASAPETTEYSCDVLVIGGGFAGLSAAAAAKDGGADVILVDKGHPGYSGLSPWPSSFRWFDADLGDDADTYRQCINLGGEYIGNMNSYDLWINESKETYERLMDWGILTQYPNATESGYFEDSDYVGYREHFDEFDRRKKWDEILSDKGITEVTDTMITNVLVKDGKVTGAVGMDVPSGTPITFTAKSVIMAMGGGCYKPTGFPVGDNTFDGEYIAYNLGLPIVGKEFDDFHMTCSWAPGNAFLNNNWTYLDNIWLCGGDITPDTVRSYATSKAKVMVLDRVTKSVSGLAPVDGTSIEDMQALPPEQITRKGGTVTGTEGDPRTGKNNDAMPKGDIYGVAVGMHAHLSCGVFTGTDELDGYTGIEGLYVAGDGIHASCPTGAAYPTGVGFTSCFVSIEGNRSGKAAAAYVSSAPDVTLDQADVEKEIEEIQAPLNVESGFDPNWARDQLQTIMAAYWVNINKSEATLSAALTQVEYMRDNVIPKLMARSGHEQRLCLEMKHKVNSAEMKLRAGLARQESRGLHYRSDFPYRDDENFLCYIQVQKGDDGSMTTSKVEIPDEWKGDLSADYDDRYTFNFPNERETLGLPEKEETSGWGH